MSVDVERTPFAQAVEHPAEDDLSAMVGLFNGLAITFTLYAAAFAVWWLW